MLPTIPKPAAPKYWQTRRFLLTLDHPLVMAIVNVTPDSFSDAGQTFDSGTALRRCEALVKQGAQLLDIGGESTRPMATPVALDEELRRVLPVVRGAVTLGVPVSVDTSRPEVMRAVLDLGADVINDVRALRDPQALAVCAAHDSVGLCLMHLPGEPDTMQALAQYSDVVAEVSAYLTAQVARLRLAGIGAQRIALDPGFGFGKTLQHNLQLMQGLPQLLGLGHPLLVGLSRKRMVGELTGRALPQDRVVASAVAALAAVHLGAHIVRVHDVAATLDALAVWRAVGPRLV
jgi:dihydropteroate synthase